MSQQRVIKMVYHTTATNAYFFEMIMAAPFKITNMRAKFSSLVSG